MNSRLIFLFALCSISFLSFSETTSTMTLGSPYLSLNQSSAPGSLYKRDMLPPPPQAVLTYTCQEPRPLVEESYNDLLRAISQKSSSDFQNVYSLALNISSDFCLLGLEMLKDASFLAVEKFLWGLTRLWSSLMLASFSALWWLMSNFTTPVFCLALLYTVTRFMVKMVSFLFGGLPIWIISIAFSLLKKSFSALRSTPKCLYEKAIDGFKSFTIPQSPPKTCVIPITHASGNHAGYASCVKLYNGENALLTATHVLRDCPNAIAVSARGLQARIPLAEFKTIAKSDKGDVTLLRGPPNWEGLLGCKAANVITAANLAKCKATIYSLEKDGWACGYAEIVGSDGTDAMVLSQTEEGHSGSPYFNGKTVLGVHSGASKKRNYNLMAPIPSIPGLTSPTYVFETTAPQGRIFAQEDVAEIENLYSGYKRLQNFKSKTGTNWGDMSEDDDIFFESKEDFSGKRSARRRPRNKRRRQLHPKDKQRRWERDDGENNLISSGKDKSREHREESGRTDLRESDEDIKTPPQKSPKETAGEFERYFSSLYDWEVPTSPCEVPGFRHCGKLPQYYHPKQKEESRWGKTLIGIHPALGEKTSGFGWPKFGPEAELKSLRLQASRWLERAQSAEIPSDAERERVIQKTADVYHPCQTNGPAATRGGTLTWNNFMIDFKQAVFSLEFDAGIGVPYIAYGKPTHRGWVEDQRLLPVLAQLTFIRLQKMLEVNFEAMEPEELIRNGLCDPIRLFVKGEPHKQAKLDEGRYRLIMSVSLVDQLVARVLFQNQNKREIALWRAVPSKPGFGLSTDEQVLDFVKCLARQVGTTTSEVITNWKDHLTPTDCSGFDWSVADWMLQDDMIVRNRLTIDLNPVTERLRSCWLRCVSNSVLCLSDGTLLAQTHPGVQKSGSYNTSSSNSRIRVMAAFHTGAAWAMAMGDDALESNPADLAAYKRLGFKVEVSGQLEFCSHIFRAPDLALPVNENKMIYKLIFGYNPGSGNAEVVANYLAACFSVLNELRHDPASVELLYSWLVDPVLPQKISRE
ncbi:P1-2 fusion protein [Brassica yellows virus]|uniref:P1-2 fusion protein n=3 Tax=Brassica yellows virus TaxID=1046403 RepID=G3E222_9VIRU|nr:P1-2 fusion protein [Brassica yellows virus]ADW41585.1 P1-2 fusion protein [Brassica yellows virus]